MLDPATWDKLPEYAVFALPLAGLATLAVLLLALRRRRNRRPPPTDAPMTAVSNLAIEDTTRAAAPGRNEIEKRIAAAVESGQKLMLAPLHLELAHIARDRGDEDSRMTALRSAAGYGALYGPHGAHAEARLELAEAAYVAGDLTSACEQWQLARTAFLQDGQTVAHDGVQKRMRDNGCPTDWVLTDF